MKSPVTIELSIIFVIFIVNFLSLAISYRRGGKAWKEKFGYKRTIHSKGEVFVSGIWAEGWLNVIWLIGYILVSLYFFDARFWDVSFSKIVAVMAFTILIITGVILHPKFVLNKEKMRSEEYRKQLKDGYSYYWFFSLAMFGGAAVSAAKVFNQIFGDVQRFSKGTQQFIDGQSKILQPTTDNIDLNLMAGIERGFVSYKLQIHDIILQYEPLMVFAIYILIVLLLLAYTPLKHSFDIGSRKIGYIVFPTVVVSLLIVALGFYYVQISNLTDTYQVLLRQFIKLEPESISQLNRLGEMLDHVMRFSGLSGFIRIFKDEGGLIVIIMALAQFAPSLVPPLVNKK